MCMYYKRSMDKKRDKYHSKNIYNLKYDYDPQYVYVKKDMYNRDCKDGMDYGYDSYCYRKPDHVHDYRGAAEPATRCGQCHDHRFYKVTGRAIPVGGGRHVHRYQNYTTFDNKHSHAMMGETGLDVSTGRGKHAHYVKSDTSCDRGHRHMVNFKTLT